MIKHSRYADDMSVRHTYLILLSYSTEEISVRYHPLELCKADFAVFIFIGHFHHFLDILLLYLFTHSFQHFFQLFFRNESIIVLVNIIEQICHLLVNILYQDVGIHKIEKFFEVYQSVAILVYEGDHFFNFMIGYEVAKVGHGLRQLVFRNVTILIQVEHRERLAEFNHVLFGDWLRHLHGEFEMQTVVPVQAKITQGLIYRQY